MRRPLPAGSADVKLLIAGGGTGGHLFPGIALAEEVTTRRPGNEVVFVGTAARHRGPRGAQGGLPARARRRQRPQGQGPLGHRARPAAPARCARSSRWRLLGRQKPGRGGRRGRLRLGPVLLAAWLRRIPTAIQEQNAVAGPHQPHARPLRQAPSSPPSPRPARFFPPRKVHLLGNPIRRALMDNFLKPGTPHGDRFALLVFGGSQGAHALNQKVLEALPHLPPSSRPAHEDRPPDRRRATSRWSAPATPPPGSTPRSASSSTTCPPPTRAPIWSSAAPAPPPSPS